MSKHKKTRQQKIIADLRKQVLIQSPITPSSTSVTLNTSSSQHTVQYSHSHAPTISTPKTISLTHSSLVIHDLQKTAILTASIVLIQLLLFLLLKNHIIVLPAVTF